MKLSKSKETCWIYKRSERKNSWIKWQKKLRGQAQQNNICPICIKIVSNKYLLLDKRKIIQTGLNTKLKENTNKSYNN